ncbi:hypothetical protein NC653_022985 [Populus alba x Populus x berolinensis]|uniref:Uncharacterized protein n=2 Tax=Populus alba x Populus x berolinensis TaxID=444605 RepID=A0AAD6MID0_9ROSI|nr:hypothetical protein NC653_022985 [Populus alba x Populus x berolinensis]
MEMKKIACAILFAAASVSAVMADEVAAPAPSPASGASASLPIVGSLVGASLASFIAVYLQCTHVNHALRDEMGSPGISPSSSFGNGLYEVFFCCFSCASCNGVLKNHCPCFR